MKAIAICIVFVFTFASCENYYYSQAEKLSADGKYQESIVLLDKVIKKNPRHVYALIDRGTYKSRLEDYNGAIEDYTKAIEVESVNALAYFNRGILKAELDNYIGAIEDYTKAIEAKGGGGAFYFETVENPFFPTGEKNPLSDNVAMAEIHFNRGYAGYHIDSLSLAFNDFSFCIGSNYEPATSYYMVGMIYIHSGQNIEAWQALTKAKIHGHLDAQEMIDKYIK